MYLDICDAVDDMYDYTIEFKNIVLTQMAFPRDDGAVNADPWTTFLDGVRAHLRVCLTLDPKCTSYSRRRKLFPKCLGPFCVLRMDLYPDNALSGCCRQLLSSNGWDDRQSTALASFFPKALSIAATHGRKAKLAISRQQAFNLRSYFSLLDHFKDLFARESSALQASVDRFQLGLARLQIAENDTLLIQENLLTIANDAKEKLAAADELRMKLQSESSLVEVESDRLRALNRSIETYDADIQRKSEVARKALLEGGPHLDVMRGALSMVGRAELGDISSLNTLLEGVEDVFAALTVLLAGKLAHVPVQRSGRVRESDRSWEKVRKTTLANVNALLGELERFQDSVEEGSLPRINLREIRPYLLLNHFRPDILERRSEVAGALCAWIISAVRYWDIVESIEPVRHEIELIRTNLNAKLEEQRKLNELIFTLSARRDRMEQLYNEAVAVSYEACRLAENSETRLDLAKRLVQSLEDERGAWLHRLRTLREEELHLVRIYCSCDVSDKL